MTPVCASKSTKRAERRGFMRLDKAKRRPAYHFWQCCETNCPWCVKRPDEPARVQIDQALFDMIVDELSARGESTIANTGELQ